MKLPMGKRLLALLAAVCLMLGNLSAPALGESGAGTPPAGDIEEMPGEPPEGGMGEMPGQPPEGGMGDRPGEPPEGGMGEMPGQPPEGGVGGAPGGQSGRPETYDALLAYDADAQIAGETIESTGTDENALLVAAGNVTLADSAVIRVSEDSTGGDAASFYGVGAALLATGGTLTVENATITTDAAGGAGVFAYGDGTVCVSDSTIATTRDASGGIHVAGGGTLYASNLLVTTEGDSSAAIRSDRGSGTMVVEGGSYTSSGSGSPAVYVTAEITIADAVLTAAGSEALCLEGLNSVALYNCDLRGNMPDLEQNDNTWTVILYQSMSGDAEVGRGRFEMDGGTLTSENGGLFYTTNTESEFVLRNVTIAAAQDSEYFLRCTGNSNQRGWGAAGANGANCVFTGIEQQIRGLVVWDSISTLDLYLTAGSALNGAVINDESCAGAGGAGYCALTIDESSGWTVTADSVLTSLCCAGTISDAEGNAVSVIGSDGTVYAEGESAYTVTVESYSTQADLGGAGAVSSLAERAAA